MLTEQELQEYRRKRIMMLDSICELLVESLHTDSVEIGSQGRLPGYPELYVKERWDNTGQSIEQVVDQIKSEIQYHLKHDQQITAEDIQLLNGALSIINKVGWEEI